MEYIFFMVLKIFLFLAIPFSIFVVLFIVKEMWKMRYIPSYSEAFFKFYDSYTGDINKEEIMENEQHSPLFEGTAGDYKIPDYIERMVEEKTELQERIEKLTIFIRSEKNLKLSKEEYEDLLLQRSAMQEYLIILNRRLQRAFKREGK